MRVSPKTEREIAAEGLWEPGTYDFEVLEAEDTQSKAGADMIKLKIKVFNGDRTQNIFDYLLDAMPGKLRHAAAAFGVLEDYDNGAFEALDCVGKTGQCKVAIQKDKTGAYPDRNGIADYIVPSAQPAARKGLGKKRELAPAGRDLDDEIPF